MKKNLHHVLSAVIITVLAFAGAGCSKQAKEARAYQRADKYFADGDYDKAEIEYINVLRLDRFASKAYGRIGTMAFEQGRISRAYAFLSHAVALDSNNLDLRIQLGNFDLTAGGQKEARKQAQFVLDKRPEDPDAPLLLADSSITLNEVDTTKQALQKLTVPEAKRAPIEVALASLYLREHELKSAQAALEKARALDPKFGPLYGALGNYYWVQKDLKHAEEAFKYAADHASVRSPRRMKYAQFKIQNQDLEGGKHILQDMAQKAPDYLPASMALANIATGEKKYDEATELVGKVLLRDPENYDALFLSGRLGMIKNDNAMAVAQFEKLAKAYPKSPQVQYQLAMAYNAANDSAKALSSLNQVLALNPNYVEAAMAVADIKLGKGELSSAIITLKDIVQRHPKLAQAQLTLADAYRQHGDIEEAAVLYKQLESTYPTNPQIPLFRGYALLQSGRRDEARKEFERSLEIAPGYLNALEQLTEIEAREGQYAKAMEQLQSVIKLDTNAPGPNMLVAKLHLAQGDAKQAIAVLQKTIVTHPDYTIAYVMLGNVYTESGQPEKTLEIAHQLLAKHPDDPGGLMELATALDAQKNIPAAEEAYEKVLKLSPKNSSALNNLAYLYAEHGQADKGLELARRARELMPFDPAAADTLGWVLYRKGDYPQASVLLQESAKKMSDVPDVQYHLGMTRYMLGEEDAARASLQSAAQSKQSFPGKDEAAASLSILAIDPKSAGPDVRASLEKRVAAQPGDPVALSRLANIYKRDGGTDKAINAYEAALKANPKNVRALMDLAQLYSTRPDQSEKAFSLANAAYKLAPEDPGLSHLLGRLAYKAGEFRRSLNLLQETAKKQQPDPELLYDLALSSYSMGQVADAVADARGAMQAGAGFTRAAEAKKFLDTVALADSPAQAVAASVQVDQIVKAEPNYVPALMATGVIAEQKPDARTAKEVFEKVLARYPDFTPAKRHLAVIYGETPGDEKHALEIAFKAHETYPDDANVTKALGMINFRLGDYTKAVRYLKESTALRSTDAQQAYYLGMAQYQLKQKPESKKSLLRALELKLPDQMAADAKKILVELK